jgi:tRNA nucleotidyltransferase (CCA-adding enzyme)
MFRAEVRKNHKNELKQKLPKATYTLLEAIVHLAEVEGIPIYLVGGSVRDLLLKRPNLDLDLVLEGNAIRFGRILSSKFGGRLVAHKSFGTAIWWLPSDRKALFHKLKMSPQKKSGLPDFFDLITARRESYRKSAALPTVQFSDIKQDQFRRDFTINTLAIRLDGTGSGHLLDPWNGLQDLRDRLLRTLHPKSFTDDPTRILRILRQAARLDFKIESKTRRQLSRHLSALKLVSGERIRTELELALHENERVAILQSMQRQRVFQTIHPKLKFPAKSKRFLSLDTSKLPVKYWGLSSFSAVDLGFIFWLLPFSSGDISAIAHRLSFRAELREAILSASNLFTSRSKLGKLKISQLVENLDRKPLLAVFAVHVALQGGSFAKKLALYARTWRHVRPKTNGDHLRRRGLKPGPAYKKILNRLRAAWLDGELYSAKQENSLLEELLLEFR